MLPAKLGELIGSVAENLEVQADHDAKVMSDPKAVKAFEKFMNLEQELLALLQKRLEQDHKMLVQMRSAISR